MCGITGIINPTGSSYNMKAVIESMSNSIEHRGPDEDGVWINDEQKLALGHRRLSVLDLSNAGSQPMHSHDNNLVMVFNGEIYNHLEIRKILKVEHGLQIQWRGHSDTETLLFAINHMGLEKALEISVGMFAFALWDKKQKSLTLARDRIGEKPLYYGWVKDNFVFASELKAIKKHPFFNNDINKTSLHQFLRFGYVPAPSSIYNNIFKLEPGNYLVLNQSSMHNQTALQPSSYWTLSDTVLTAKENIIHSHSAAMSLIEDKLEQSIKLQMISDVPLGGFLSGGIDSSLIVSLMQSNSMQKIKTFTIGFEDANFDESQFAKKVAQHLGTDHEELLVTADQVHNIIPQLPIIYDEPFADSSQIPTFFVALAASQKVTVALSGDAGDEVFGGYNRYIWGPKIWNNVSALPFQLRNILGKGMQSISMQNWDHLSKVVNSMLVGSRGVVRLGDKLHKLGRGLQASDSFRDFFYALITEWDDLSQLVQCDDKTLSNKNLINFFPEEVEIKEFSSKMMFADSLSYLPDDILCKVDRAAMSNSIETRAPFLDHRLIEAAWRLPQEFKVNEFEGKLPLRYILNKYVPKQLIDRPKVGFGIPIGEWLRGPLKNWAEELINPSRLDKEGFFISDSISSIWALHLSGHSDCTEKLWRILMFQSWLENEKMGS